MSILELINSSVNSLTSNKLRTFLTMIGIVIGVFSVVAMISLGKGIENFITDQFDELGSNLIFIAPGKAGLADDPATSFTSNKLEEKHVELINEYASEMVVETSPYVATGQTAEYKTKSFFSEVTGVNSEALAIVNYELDRGRIFTDTEEKNNSRIIIIGPSVEQELYPNEDPLGKKLKIRDNSYQIIGTFEEKGENYDDQIIMPYTTLMNDFEVENLSSIVTKSKDGVSIERAGRQIEVALLRDLEEDEFSVLTQTDLLSTINEILGALTIGLGSIAGISLVVGGIGIMNIMLVAVTERTREIGLRKAIGATSEDIARQFILEAVIISFIGGSAGVLLAVLLTAGIQPFLRAEIPLYAVAIAFGFSAVVGIIFGTYPAVKASNKDPIEALRYE